MAKTRTVQMFGLSEELADFSFPLLFSTIEKVLIELKSLTWPIMRKDVSPFYHNETPNSSRVYRIILFFLL